MKHIGRLEVTQEFYFGSKTTAEIAALTPKQPGAFVWDSDLTVLYFWDGITWAAIGGGGGGGTTNLGTIPTATTLTVTSDTGTNAVLSPVTPSAGTNQSGLIIPTDKDKLDLITITGAVDLDNIVDNTLTSGEIFVGNGSNVATGVAMSGDATLTNAGVLTITRLATPSQQGIVEMATDAEADTGTSTTLALSPANGEATYIKKTSINAKGDVIFGSANDTATVLPASGNNGAFLIEDSTTVSGWNNMRNNYEATTAPGVGDDAADGYRVGSVWVDETADAFYVCVDNTNGAAVWASTGSAAPWSFTTLSTPGTIIGDGTPDVMFAITNAAVALDLDSANYTAGARIIIRNATGGALVISNGSGNFTERATTTATISIAANDVYTFSTDGTDWLVTSKLVAASGSADGYHVDVVRGNATKNVAPTIGEHPSAIDGSSAQILLSDGSIEHWNFDTAWTLQFTESPTGGYRYTSAQSEIWATGLGVTTAIDGVTGIWTIAVPAGVIPLRVAIDFNVADTSPSPDFDAIIRMDYTGARSFNTGVTDFIVPTGGIMANGTPPTTGGGEADFYYFNNEGLSGNSIKLQIGAIGGGDGSDIDYKLISPAIAADNTLLLNFGEH
jgi:hypothetical protein